MRRKILITLILCICIPYFLFAATFNVNDISSFQNALNTASTNGENDIINIASGTYNVTSAISYWTDEEYSLSIVGDNMPVFNGGDTTKIMELVTASTNGDLEINGIILEHGHSDYGGAIYLETYDANISVINCTVRNNSAGIICGGVDIYSETGNITVSNCDFSGNSSPNTSGYPYGTAGGLFIQTVGSGAEMTLENSTFENNTAQRDAAGAMLYPTGTNAVVNARNNTFDSNTAVEFGGGCWIRSPAGNTIVNCENNILHNNNASSAGSGGGTYIEIESGTINYVGNEHTSNYASWQGGGLWISNINGAVNMHSNTFKDNESGQTGGGANIYLESGSSEIYQNIFNENQAGDAGGGLNYSTTSSSAHIYANSFYANTSLAESGGDIYLYFDDASSSADFYNNILYGSTSPAMDFSGMISVIARYCDIENGTGENWFGTGCIDTNPMFVNPANDDFNLSWANFPTNDATKSPCIDSGDVAVSDADSTRSDMGALFFNQATLDAPENVSISFVGKTLTITWDAVCGASSYNIYSSTVPNSGFTLEQSGISTTEWSKTILTEIRRFYVVRSQN